MKTKELVLTALFAAITCVLSIISIPIGAVPITLQVFAVVLAGAILGAKLGFFSQLVYAFLGAIGLPVFSGMTGGFSVIVGPTGGYIIGFVLAAGIIGWIVEFGYRKLKKIGSNAMILVAMIIGLVVIYLIGMIQLSLVLKMPISAAFKAGVVPFIGIDFIKIIAAWMVAVPVRHALKKAKLIGPVRIKE